MNIQSKAKQITIKAKVIRASGQVEDLGIVAFAHRNLVKMLLWRLGETLKRKKGR